MKNTYFSIVTSLIAANYTFANNLIVTEFMPSPSGYDNDREWFEIYNADREPVNLNGIEFHSNGTQDFTVTQDTYVDPGQYYVFGVSYDPLVNGGIEVDYVYNYRHFSLAQNSDIIKIVKDEVVLDEVNYENASEGKSFFLPHYKWDNSQPGSWMVSNLPSSEYGEGGYGTPGDVNEDILDIVIENAPQSGNRGDILSFDITVSNPTDHDVVFDSWLTATQYDMSYMPILYFDNLLKNDEIVSKTVTISVPVNASTGDYVVSTNFGNFENTATWSKSFVVNIE